MSPYYVKTLAILSFVLSFSVTYLIGVDNPFNFLAAFLCIWLVFTYLLSISFRRIIPPRIEIYYPEDLSLNLSKKQRY